MNIAAKPSGQNSAHGHAHDHHGHEYDRDHAGHHHANEQQPAHNHTAHDDHAHGHSHDHAPRRAHPGVSLLRMSSLQRLALALTIVAAIWLSVFWAWA